MKLYSDLIKDLRYHAEKLGGEGATTVPRDLLRLSAEAIYDLNTLRQGVKGIAGIAMQDGVRE